MMRCPICGSKMRKVDAGKRFKSKIMRCDSCNFVVFYNGVKGVD